MSLAVAGYIWAAFGAVLTVFLGVILALVVVLVRRLKQFSAATRHLSEDLTSAMEAVNEQLGRAGEGMSRLGERRIR